MPSSVNVNGLVTRRPGVYSIVDASALSGRELDINNVAVVGEFLFLEAAVPTHAATFRNLADLQFSDSDLALLASILYNSANDDRVTGGPNRTTLVNVAPTTQANNTFDDDDGTASILMKSKAWGSTGNKVITNISAGTTSGQQVIVSRDGRTEIFDNLGLSDVVSFEYDGVGLGAATAVTLTFDNTVGLTIVNTITGVSASLAPTKLAFDGTVKITASAPLGAGEVLGFTVTGTNKATGAPDSETLAFVEADTVKTTAKAFSAVSSILLTNQVGFGGTWAIEADGFVLPIADYAKASSLVDRVNSHSSYTAINEEPQASSVGTDELDNVGVTTIFGASKGINANVFAIMQDLVNSSLVTVERAAGCVKEPANTVSDVPLAGGGSTTPSLSDWVSAFESLETQSIQIVATSPQDLLDVSGVSGVHGALRDHCVKMAGEGADERNGWAGAATDDTLSALKTRAVSLNSRFVSLVFDDITVIDPSGNERELDPSMFGVMMAGMQSGTAIAVPLTGKRPNVITAGHNSAIKTNQDANELLKNGLVFMTTDRLGLKVERSITTYMTDDNPIFSEMSAVESVNTSVRDLRANLATMIGDPSKITTKGRIRTLTLSQLDDQVTEGIIKAYIDSSVVVEDLGDTFSVSYQMAPVEPVNFIVVTALVQRISS